MNLEVGQAAPRSTFIIDKHGKLAKIFRKVKVQGHVQEVLDFVENNLQ